MRLYGQGRAWIVNNKIEIALAASFPALLFPHQACERDVFGFECLDGWYSLIEGSLYLISQYAESGVTDVTITQVKEKFGQLRIYLRGGNECIAFITAITELVSGCICERCGGPGEIVNAEGWLVARCNTHRNHHYHEEQSAAAGDECFVAEYVQAVGSIWAFFAESGLSWVRQPSLSLGNRRPYEMLGTIEGCKAVYTLLGRLEHGVGV